MNGNRHGKERVRIKTLLIAIMIFFGPSLLFAGSDFQHVLLLVDPHTLPDSRPPFTFMMPVTRVSLMTTNNDLKAQLERTRVIVIEMTTINRLENGHGRDLKMFLRNSIEDGRQIWFIGVSIPDNFVQDYLGLQAKMRIHRQKKAYHVIASGIWRNGGRHVTKDIVTTSVLPRQEIITRILNKN